MSQLLSHGGLPPHPDYPTLNILGHADERGHGPGVPPKSVILRPVAPHIVARPDRHPVVVGLHLKLLAAGLPGITWVGSPNYTPGRTGLAIDGGVQHTAVGNAASVDARFGSAASQVSAHLLALEAGGFNQYVPFDGGSWANGNWDYNMRKLTMEREDSGNYARPLSANPVQEASIAIMWAHLGSVYGFPMVHAYSGLIGHKEVPGSSTACPDGIDMDELAAVATSGGNVAPIQEVVPYAPVPAVVYDVTPADGSLGNWREEYDYDSMGDTGSVLDCPDNGRGQTVHWERAKYVFVNGSQQWLCKLAGTAWAVTDGCLDDSAQAELDGHPGKYDPPDFVTGPAPEWQRNLVAVAHSFQLGKAVAPIAMDTGKPTGGASVGPGPLDTAWSTSSGGVEYWVTDWSAKHLTGTGFAKADVAAASVPPPPVPAPPVPTPAPNPGPAPVPPSRAQGCLAAPGRALANLRR